VDKGKEELAAIGAQVPATAANAIQEGPKGPGFVAGIMRQVSGTVPRTVNKDGVIISQSSKGGDIIEAVIQNNGTLPDNFDSPIYRTPPSRDVRPLPSTQKSSGEKKLSLQPAQPGAPPTGDNPTKPAAAQPTTPATPPPANTGAKP